MENNKHKETEAGTDRDSGPVQEEAYLLSLLVRLKPILIRSLILLVVFFAIGWAIREELTALIKWPLLRSLPPEGAETILLRVIDAFMVHVKVCFYFSCLAVITYLTFTLFTKPATSPERRNGFNDYLIPLAMVGRFFLGVGFAFVVALPAAFDFLVSYSMEGGGLFFGTGDSSAGNVLQISMREHVSLTMKMLIAFGLGFESPLAMLAISRSSFVTSEDFARHRGLALIVLAAASSILTPPDPWTMLLLLGPLYALYELGIFLTRWVAGPESEDKGPVS